MYKRRLLLLAVILYSLNISAQYRGGINDGFVFSSINNTNANPDIYRGGNQDGFSLIKVTNQNAGPNIYTGGIDDGFAFVRVINQNAVPNIYCGGRDDGFSVRIVINQNAVPNIFTGGNDDGFSVIKVTNQNAVPNIFTGGSNDGYGRLTTLALNVSPGIYAGGINDGWEQNTVTSQNPTVAPNPSTINLKLFIQGFYTGNGLMNNSGIGGCLFIEGFSPNPADVDTVFISAINSGTLAEVNRKAGILKTNGTVSITFDNSVHEGSSYYIKITHRNAITTWSSLPVLMNSITSYDFTTAISKAYGNNQIESFDNQGWTFFSGDFSDVTLGVGHQDGVIESQDYSDMMNAVNIISLGYVPEDITGDGVVESLDYSIMEDNIRLIISSMHP